jgi:hypothetical protein
MKHILRLFSLLFLLPAGLMAQVTTTSIVGTATDSTGAVVPGITVTATDVDRNQSKSAVTGNSGEYRIDFLLTGNYTLTAKANGFKTFTQAGIQLNAGAPVTIDVQMSAGDVTEKVEVLSSAPLVNTVNAEVGTTIDSTQMIELPLVNRNAYQLLDLTPGVQTNSNIQSFGAPAQITLINGGSDNGAGSVNYFLDGAPNLTGLRNTGNILPNPDALQEFRVQTSNYGAPYGRFASGIVNALVKSGTNTVHGSVFEFIRNQAFSARDWGSSSALPKTPLHRNQFGATLGGPILRDRTFFFGSYAGLRQSSGTFMNNAVLPTAAEATGDFRSSSKKPVNPLTNAPYSCQGVQNVICGANQDPVAVNLLKSYLPAANTTVSGLPGWQGYYTAPYNTDDFLIKINHTLNANQQLAVTYFNSSGLTSVRGGSSNVPYAAQQQFWRQQNAVINHTWTISPTVVNNIWVSYTRFLSNRVNTPEVSLADLGSAFTPQGVHALPNISITGFFTLGNSNGGPGFTNNYAVRDLVTWTKGNHSIQWGGEAVLDKSQKVANLTNFGSFSFNGGMTGNPFADFLIGKPSSAQQDAPASVSAVTLTSSLFLQDDWRLNRRLTVNLGVRWDVQTPPVDTSDRESAFVPGQQSTVRPNAPTGLLFPGDKGITRGITPVSYRHFSPRVGFALDPFGTGKTSLRGGAGIFWGSVSEETWMASGNTIPFAIRYGFVNISKTTGPTLSNPYRDQPSGNIFPYSGNFYPVAGPIQPTSPNTRFPYTIQMNMSVQQQLTNSMSLAVSYVGSLAKEQPFAPDLNYPSLNTNYGGAVAGSGCPTGGTITATTGNVQCRRQYQPFGTITQLGSPQNSSFHSLQTTITKRMEKHLSISAYYMWAKSLSSVQLESSGPGGSTAQNANNLRAERGRTDNDYRHTATIGIVWQPDYYQGQNRWIRNIANGWEISPLARLHTGAPFTVTNSLDANLDGNTNDRAQVISDPNLGSRTLNQWFNTSAFAQNLVVNGKPIDGNSPRNYLTGPATHTVDLNLARTFGITERVKFQFRAEASNAFNIVNYNTPGATVNTATFGAIRSNATTTPMRQIQFGGKILF